MRHVAQGLAINGDAADGPSRAVKAMSRRMAAADRRGRETLRLDMDLLGHGLFGVGPVLVRGLVQQRLETATLL